MGGFNWCRRLGKDYEILPQTHETFDLRQPVIEAYKGQMLGRNDNWLTVSCVSLSFVQRLIRRHRTTGQAANMPHRGGAIALHNSWGFTTLCSRSVNQQPDALLAKLCDRFVERSWREPQCAKKLEVQVAMNKPKSDSISNTEGWKTINSRKAEKYIRDA